MALANWEAELRIRFGVRYELFRLFWRRYFETDWATSPDQLRFLLISSMSLMSSVGIFIALAVFRRYFELHLNGLGRQYEQTALGDRLLFVCYAMLMSGFLCVMRWRSLFPDAVDHYVLSPMPLKTRDIFGMKFLSLAAFVALFVAAANLQSCVMLPLMQMGRMEQANPFLIILAQAISTTAASFTVFFTLAGVQGLLSLLLPARVFERVSAWIQNTLLILLICGLPPLLLLLGGGAWVDGHLAELGWAPPIWFLGLYQALLKGFVAPWGSLAIRALMALGGSLLLCLTFYWLAYVRQGSSLMERAARPGTGLPAWALRRMAGGQNIQGHGCFHFIWLTLLRSGQQRTLLSAWTGIGIALAGFVLLRTFLNEPQVLTALPSQATRRLLLFIGLALGFWMIGGLRFVVGLPADVRANWLFRVAPEHPLRDNSFAATERFFYLLAAPAPPLLLLPFSVWLLGIGFALAMFVFHLLLSLLLVEFLLHGLESFPFTSSYTAGKKQAVQVFALYAAGFLFYTSLLGAMTVGALESVSGTLLLLGVLVVAWSRLGLLRLHHWRNTALQFQDDGEPAVRTLNLSE